MDIRPRKFLPLLVLTLRAAPQPDLPSVNVANFLPVIREQIEQSEQAARAHPRDPEIVGALAMTLHAYQQYNAAARVYSYTLRLDPRNFGWLYLLGAVQMELGDFEAARSSFQSAVELRPGDLPAQLRLAQASASQGRFQEAEALYRKILEQHGDCPQAWYGLGRVQASQGDRAAAVDSYTKACDLFPAYGAAHFALAQELRHAGQAADAQRHVEAYAANATASPPLEDPLFQRISELNHGAQAHMQRSAELERAGRLDDAVREQEAALAADPLNVQVRVNLISLYGRTGNPAKAQEQFESAIRLNPGRSDAWYNYGVLLLHERASFAEAERAFRRAVEINPDHAESHDHLGMLYEQQGRLDDAAVEFRHAVAAKPDYPAARFHLGRILVNQQKYDEAIRQFLRALDPETEQTPACLYALGATYARSGDRPRAVEYLRKARAAAVTHSQQQLLAGIDRDLKTLEDER